MSRGISFNYLFFVCTDSIRFFSNSVYLYMLHFTWCILVYYKQSLGMILINLRYSRSLQKEEMRIPTKITNQQKAKWVPWQTNRWHPIDIIFSIDTGDYLLIKRKDVSNDTYDQPLINQETIWKPNPCFKVAMKKWIMLNKYSMKANK